MKLDGIRVIDLSLFLPGPLATQMMADHGARVIKIENPAAPEPGRSTDYFPWAQGGHTVMYRSTHRGKESVTLNLKDAAAKALFLKLVGEADVLVESFRPGVMARLGLDPATLRGSNPRLVYCSLSAFGQSGPWRDVAAHDTATVAAAGVLSLSRSPEGGGPALLGVAIADILAAQLLFGGIVMALYRRATTGQGDYLDVSMFEAALAAQPNIVGPVFGAGRAPDPNAERTHGGNAMFNIYATRDGGSIALGGGEKKFVANLFGGLGRPEFIAPVSGPAGPAHAPAIRFLREAFGAKTRTEWEAWLKGRDIPAMPVFDLAEAWSQPHVRERAMRVTDAAGNDHIGIPIKYADEPGRVNPKLASVGQHTDAVLSELGCDAAHIARLHARGAI
ncbi:MAG: CoA transferase [Alphaproteobacteria bacterium]|nr:CoA transferase [Alphaproteobacteria bacterium]